MGYISCKDDLMAYSLCVSILFVVGLGLGLALDRWGKREKEALSEGDGKVYKEPIWSTYIIVLPEYAYNVPPFTVFSNAVCICIRRVFDGEYNGSFFNICDSSFILPGKYTYTCTILTYEYKQF
jgi:hypothetical protein